MYAALMTSTNVNMVVSTVEQLGARIEMMRQLAVQLATCWASMQQLVSDSNYLVHASQAVVPE